MKSYDELTLEARVETQQRLESGDSLRAIGRSLGRSPSMISFGCRRSSARNGLATRPSVSEEAARHTLAGRWR
jgi:IS30 family transposase